MKFGEISGSLTHLTDGTSYLIAGTNINIVSESWGAVTISSTGGGGGGGTPANPDESVQFNDGGSFGGSANFTFSNAAPARLHLTGAFMQGFTTFAVGQYSHAEGDTTVASGPASHTEGVNTLASGDFSHAEGAGTIASNTASHSEGTGATASGIASHAEGYQTTASNDYSHAEGDNTTASGLTSHAEGLETIAEGNYSHAEGDNTRVTSAATGGHAEGQKTLSSNDYAHVEGYLTTGSGRYSHAEGNRTIAQGTGAHAEGYLTTGSGIYSHAEGTLSIASGEYSHAEGTGTQAVEQSSHTEGFGTTSYGLYSHAEGAFSITKGPFSHAEGYYTIASGSAQTVCGKYNERDNDFSLFVVGNGTGDLNANRKDVLRVNPGVANIGRVEVTGSLVVTKYYAGDSETLTSAGAVDEKLHLTMFNNTTPGTTEFTLADGDNVGQLKYFVKLSGGSTVITSKLIPATPLGSWSFIEFETPNQNATLMWTPQGWAILSVYGATVT
jgi:hypothetical protein